MGSKRSELTDKTKGGDLFKNELELFINDVKTKSPESGKGILTVVIEGKETSIEIEDLDELKTLLGINS